MYNDILHHINELNNHRHDIKRYQDQLLDTYDPNDVRYRHLLIELSSLHNELDDIEREFESLLNSTL